MGGMATSTSLWYAVGERRRSIDFSPFHSGDSMLHHIHDRTFCNLLSISRLPTTTYGALLGLPACAPVRCQQRPPVVRAVEVDAFSPVLRGPRGMEDRAC